MDYLIPQQLERLKQAVVNSGFSWSAFQCTQENGIDTIFYLPDSNYYFQFYNHSLQGLRYRDVFFYYYDAENIERRHWYFGCNSFIEALNHFSSWLNSLSNL